MLNVTVRAGGATEGSPPNLDVELQGDITDASNLSSRFAGLTLPSGATLRVLCDQVRYINSAGVKQWIHVFEGYRGQGVRLLFRGCSPAVVSQINLMANFVRKDEIESLQLPFQCPKCHRELLIERTVKELKPDHDGGLKMPAPLCESCSAPLQFDEVADEYLHFLG